LIQIQRNNSPLTQKLLARPPAGGTSTATFDPLPVGTLAITASAYPNADGTGTAQATATAPLAIQAGQDTPFSLTMASTIDHLEVAPSPVTLVAGRSTPVLATAKDGAGNVVLTSAFQWASADPSIAAVDQSGEVTAANNAANQSTTVTVTETESRKSAPVTVYVTPVPPPVLQQSVTYQINPGHSGSVTFGQQLVFPATPTWSVKLDAAASYPLIAEGKVFVTTADNTKGSYGTTLYALDVATGKSVWGPVAISGTYFWSAIAYEKGKVFVINCDGLLRSFDAATGTPGWSVQLPGQYAFSAAPTAVNGVVYVGGAGSGGTLYAVDETNGNVLWTASVENGDESSPAISTENDGVFVSYPCQVYKFDPKTGASLWHYSGPCEGGGGKTTAYANGLLYVRDGNGSIFDGKTGDLVGRFISGPIPALGPKTGFFLNAGTLLCEDLTTHQVLWSFAGDGSLASAPILIDQTVIVGSGSGNVYALDAATGNTLWTGNAGAGIPGPDEQNVSQPLTGLGAGEGYLVVPAGSTLTGWHIAGP
jgi:outer membrane protein assembly factor BamB